MPARAASPGILAQRVVVSVGGSRSGIGRGRRFGIHIKNEKDETDGRQYRRWWPGYFLLMFAIGAAFRKMASQSASDYFRGGGRMLWWMVGSSAFMIQFSAWTFTGAAGEAFRNGLPACYVYIGNCVGLPGRHLLVRQALLPTALRRTHPGDPPALRARQRTVLHLVGDSAVDPAGRRLAQRAGGVLLGPSRASTPGHHALAHRLVGAGAVLPRRRPWGVVASDFVQSIVVAGDVGGLRDRRAGQAGRAGRDRRALSGRFPHRARLPATAVCWWAPSCSCASSRCWPSTT